MLIALSLTLLIGLADVDSSAESVVSDGAAPQPNVLFVLTDDQDIYMDGAKHQPKIQKLLAEEGVTLVNQFVSTPVCCPSRGGMLTGRYIHNVPMTNNSIEGNCSGPAWNAGPEKQSAGVLMQRKGYMTAFAGKYLNRYGMPAAGGVSHVPPGWDEWLGLVGNSVYYNYTLSNNGVAEHHGDDYATDYLTDLLGNRTRAFLRHRWAPQAVGGRPFFAMVSTPACHGPHEPAPQYAHAFTNSSFAAAVRTPNFGAATTPPGVGAHKHWLIEAEARQWHADARRREAFVDWEHVRRLETLLSVDDLVEALVLELDSLKALASTFIFYTTDHGYHLGQFGLLKDKRMPYEFDIRVPGYVRGPGLPKNVTSAAIALSIDLLPTFLDVAGHPQHHHAGAPTIVDSPVLDGQSLLPLLKAGAKAPASRSFLVEYHGESAPAPSSGVCKDAWGPGLACWQEGTEKLAPGPFAGGALCSCQDSTNNTYACVRTLDAASDSIYCEFADTVHTIEYYDLRVDPWQMRNAASELPEAQREQLASRLEQLRGCAGESCD